MIAPQCTKEDGWVNIRGFGINYKMKENPQSRSLEAFMELIDSLKTKYKIDSDRLYLTGLSLGGAATLDTIARNPNVFACGITMCSYIAPIYDVESFKYANLWQFHGIIDEVCPYKRSEEMVGAIKKKGYYAHLTSYPAATYKLIDDMMSSISKNFLTNKVHIGMDEAFLVGAGSYFYKNGYKDKKEILLNHLNKVLEISRKYNLKPMMWADMFFRFYFNSEYYVPNKEVPEAFLKQNIPSDVKQKCSRS